MAIEGFNYKEFSQNLAQQASEIIPQDIAEEDKQFIVNIIFNFCNLAGDAINNDNTSKFTLEQALLICQFIGEWSFHKSIDVVRSHIDMQFREPILQKIAFTVFEVTKQGITRGFSQDQLIQLVEHQVQKTYSEAMKSLLDRGILNPVQYKAAVAQSNIDEMIKNIPPEEQEAMQKEVDEEIKQQKENEQKAQQQQQASQEQKVVRRNSPQAQPKVNPAANKTFKLAAIALLLKKIPKEKIDLILSRFPKNEATTILQYIKMPDLEAKLDINVARKYLQELKITLPEATVLDPDFLKKKISKILKKVSHEKLEHLLSNERVYVKNYLLKGEDEAFPPRVLKVMQSYLEEKLR